MTADAAPSSAGLGQPLIFSNAGKRANNCADWLIDDLGGRGGSGVTRTSSNGLARCTCGKTKVREPELLRVKRNPQALKNTCFGCYLAFMDTVWSATPDRTIAFGHAPRIKRNKGDLTFDASLAGRLYWVH